MEPVFQFQLVHTPGSAPAYLVLLYVPATSYLIPDWDKDAPAGVQYHVLWKAIRVKCKLLSSDYFAAQFIF